MKKVSLSIVGLLSIAGCAVVSAREIRTPIPFMYGMMHYPVQYNCDPMPKSDDCCWDFDFTAFGGAYSRSADKAYGPCSGTCKVPWSNLIFGKSVFRLEEAFAGADIGTLSPDNVFVAISNLKTNYEYRERGAVFGAEISSHYEYCDVDYRFGLRARLPFRESEVADICGLSDLVGIGLDDVYREREETTLDAPTETNTVYAARLDFLSVLQRIASPVEPLVAYGTATTHTRIADQDVDSDINNVLGEPFVGAIYRADGTAPTNVAEVPYWGEQTTGFDATINADGSGVGQNDRGRFVNGTDYAAALGGDTAAQSRLWIVPTLTDQNLLSTGALAIQSAINLAVKNLDGSVEDFLAENGIDLCDGRNQGLGDLDLELYAGRNWGCDQQFWTDVMFGVTFPTAKDLCDCKLVLKQPNGNNGHFEIHGGFAAGWDASSWVKFMCDLQGFAVLSDSEKVAAPFQGATVKNIGPCINADVKWSYLLGHADLTFFASDCCGFDFGYEIYHKGCDKICLCQKTAVEFLDRGEQPLSASVLTKDTSRTSHKLRVGFFSAIGDCEIFGGWSHIVAGKNIGRETDFYLSMTVNF